MNLQKQITAHAHSLGFDLVGFTKAKIDPCYQKVFKNWLKNHNEGSMKYMRKFAERSDLTKILPNARSVIVLAVNYYHKQEALKKDHGRVARYAYGRDYHKIIIKKLKKLEQFIIEIAPKAHTKSCVDTGPILERALAKQAGIGTIGKNGSLITPEFGSWVFLAEIITDLELHRPRRRGYLQKTKDIASHPCNNCTRCIQSCPTGAIIAPGIIDARRCISYLTIENKSSIPPDLAKIIKRTMRIFGCDICQEACPKNITRQKPLNPAENPIHEAFASPCIAGNQLSLNQISKIRTDKQFLEKFAGSPIMRTKRTGLTRNAKILS